MISLWVWENFVKIKRRKSTKTQLDLVNCTIFNVSSLFFWPNDSFLCIHFHNFRLKNILCIARSISISFLPLEFNKLKKKIPRLECDDVFHCSSSQNNLTLIETDSFQ